MPRQWAMGAGSPRCRPIRIARSNAAYSDYGNGSVAGG